MMNLLRCFLTVCSNDVLTLLYISSIYYYIVFLMTLLMLVLNRFLMTLLMRFAETLKVVMLIVSISRICFCLGFGITLDITSMPMGDNLRVMTNNSRAMVNLLVSLLAVFCSDILTFLNVSSIHNNIILLVAFLIIISLTGCIILYVISCMTLALFVIMTAMSVSRSSMGNTSNKKSYTKFEHFGEYLPTYSME